MIIVFASSCSFVYHLFAVISSVYLTVFAVCNAPVCFDDPEALLTLGVPIIIVLFAANLIVLSLAYFLPIVENVILRCSYILLRLPAV